MWNVARLLLLVATLGVSPQVAAQQMAERPPAEIATMDLPSVVAALRRDCTLLAGAYAELKRRRPDVTGEAGDCGSGPAADFDATVDDAALLAGMERLAHNAERLVARGEALKAAGATLPAAPAAPAPQRPAPAKAPAASGSPAAKPRTPRDKECEAQHYADVRLCSDSTCRMRTYRRWQSCLKTGRYW